MKRISYLLAFVLFFYSCTSTDPATEETTEEVVNVENTKVDINIDKLKEKVLNLRGGSFLKDVNAKDGNIEVNYVANFNDLKSTYPMITTTEADYKKEMGKDGEIDKMLTEVPVKLLMKFPEANSVALKIPFEAVTYHVKITKKQLEELTGKTFAQISDNYTENYANKFVFEEAGREEFIAKFVTK